MQKGISRGAAPLLTLACAFGIWGILRGEALAAEPSIERWTTASQCQSLSGRPGFAELRRIECHRDQIGNVRFLNRKTSEVRDVVRQIRGEVAGKEKGLCIETASFYRSSVPPPVRGGVCSAAWKAWRDAYDELWDATCNIGVTRFGSMAGPIYDAIDRTRAQYESCFDDALRLRGRPYSRAVEEYRIGSREALRELWQALVADYLKHRDRYTAFHEAHVEACNATAAALERSHPQLVAEHSPSCAPGF